MPQEGFDDSLSKRRRRILEMNREAARFYHSVLLSPEGKVGYDYYIGRALSAATINHFGLGFAPISGTHCSSICAPRATNRQNWWMPGWPEKGKKGIMTTSVTGL